MFDWFDLMRQAQKSAGTAALAQQFHLSEDQIQRTMAAFLPAFAMGMQHAVGANPSHTMFQSMLGGAYQNLWLNAAQAFSPSSQRNGKQILDQLFGSDDVSRRVARQAADITGVNVDVMQQMLPVLAGIYAGGFYHWMSGQARAMQTTTPSATQEPSSPDLIESWSRLCAAWAGAPKAKPEASPLEMMMMMMASLLPPPETLQETKTRRAATPPGWEEMMEKGRDLQKQYLASLQSIFDEVQKAGAKKS